MIISRSILLTVRKFPNKLSRENQSPYFTFIFFSFNKSCRLWDYVEKWGRAGEATDDNTIPLMPFACWITNATNTHSEYIILIAFPRQQWLRERASMLHYSTLPGCYKCMLQERTSGTAEVHQTVPGTHKGHETTRSGRDCFVKITFNKLSQKSSIKLSHSSDGKYGSTALSTFTVGFLIHSYLRRWSWKALEGYASVHWRNILRCPTLAFQMSLRNLNDMKTSCSWIRSTRPQTWFPYQIFYFILSYQHEIRTFTDDKFNPFNPLTTKRVCFILRTQCVPRCKHRPPRLYKASLLMLCRAKVAVCSENHTKHINAMWGPCRIFEC